MTPDECLGFFNPLTLRDFRDTLDEWSARVAHLLLLAEEDAAAAEEAGGAAA